MREAVVESKLRRAIQTQGGRALKFVSPGNAGVPDRLILFPVPEADRETVAKYVRFVEVKAPGKTLRPNQVLWQQRLRSMGLACEVIDQ